MCCFGVYYQGNFYLENIMETKKLNYKKRAQERFARYEVMARIADTSYRKVSYIDEGQGEVILVCHGI